MVKIRINNSDIEVPEDITVLQAAELTGVKIPTLCHKEGLPHYTSCFVCIVKDNFSGRYIPSCSALVQDGMDIDTAGEEVVRMRKHAIELLLSEHRAECEAPCRIVCPAGLNIPLMNRIIASGDFGRATELFKSELTAAGTICETCPGYCENACRRKKIDSPVSIRNLQLYISKQVNNEALINNENSSENSHKPDIASRKNLMKQRFSSRIGKIEPAELKEWMKECEGQGIRCTEINSPEDAVNESMNCMHCDCRAADNCRLRDLADEYRVKDPRGKIISTPLEKKINKQTGLIFEHSKCIKCGLCVRVCGDNRDDQALCFINRGFLTVLSEPLTEEFDSTLKTMSDKCIEICPTGALSRYREK
ncbi:MAG: 2Fe-2S iron-sulfur cluster-binding protein [Bacteroidales bacterium]|jgi:ferredoxin|nr:2Fe-2S iron-sulfur cluster-binding protein [Bacteroidales bacterium]